MFGALAFGPDIWGFDEPPVLGPSSSGALGPIESGVEGVIDVISTNTTAADVRNAQELQQRIKANGGVVRASANSSDYIVAVNNRLKFSVTRTANGQYEIRESNYFAIVIGAGIILGVLVLASR